MSSAQRKYFGTDGVRGRVGNSPITPEFAMKLGWAAGRVLAKQSAYHTGVLIGKDTRLSGYLLEASLEAGFSAAGVDVYLTGPLPTPAIAHLTRALRRSAGIVISASHNPYYDNGIKFFSANGSKLPDEVEAEIERELDQPLTCVAPNALGKAWRVDDACGRYIEFCKSVFPNHLDLRGHRILVDCAHGATYHTAPSVFHELGAEVTAVACEPNGVNINDGVGAVHSEFLAKQMQQNQADWGIALDGDGDRLIMADPAGRIYDGDALLYIIARDMQRSNRLRQGEGVVGTLMSNFGLEQSLARCGIELVRAKVGDRYVMETLQQKGWRVGGENSGHLIHLDHHTTGDGIIAALLVMQALVAHNIDLAEATRDLQLFPQQMINVRLDNPDWPYRKDPGSHASIKAALNELSAQLGKRGRILLRSSGTEPLVRVMVEAEDAPTALQYAEQLAQVVKAAID